MPSPRWAALLWSCAVLLTLAPTPGSTTQLTWSVVTPTGSVPAGRESPALIFDNTNNQLVLFGGLGVSGYLQDTWTFSISTSTWTERTGSAGTAPDARDDMIADEDRINKRMIICMGQGASGFFNDVWSYDLQTNTWSQLSPSGTPPETRYGMAGGIYPNGLYLYVSHGFADKRYSNTFRLDLTSLVWTERNEGNSINDPWAPHARCLVGYVMTGDDSFVMYGGCASGGETVGPCPAQDVWLYSDRSASWKMLEICPTPRRHPAMARLWGTSTDDVILHGGIEKTNNLVSALEYQDKQIDILNTRTGLWTTYKTASTDVPARRHSHKMVTVWSSNVPAYVLMWGGRTLSGDLDTTMYKLNGNYDESDIIYDCPGWLSYTMIHAIFMFLAWGFCLQIGSFMARYYKHRNPYWFKMHKLFQISGLVFSFFGLIFGIISVAKGGNKSHFYFAHGAIGLIVVLGGFQQPLNAFIRPHPGKSWRPLWEIIHKGAGRTCLLLGLINITLGLFIIQSPVKLWATWLALLTVYFIMHIILTQHKYRLLNHVTSIVDPAPPAALAEEMPLVADEEEAVGGGQHETTKTAEDTAADPAPTTNGSRGFFSMFKREKTS